MEKHLDYHQFRHYQNRTRSDYQSRHYHSLCIIIYLKENHLQSLGTGHYHHLDLYNLEKDPCQNQGGYCWHLKDHFDKKFHLDLSIHHYHHHYRRYLRWSLHQYLPIRLDLGGINPGYLDKNHYHRPDLNS